MRSLLQDAAKDLDIVEHHHTKFRGLSQCGILQAKAGDIEASRQSFQRAREMIRANWPENEHIFWRMFAQDCAEAGNVKEALEIIKTLPAPGRGSRISEAQGRLAVVRECALRLVKAGKDQEALELAKTANKPEDVRNDVLHDIAIRQAEAGDWKAVQATLASIADPDAKIRTLAGTTFWNVQAFDLSLPNRPGIALIHGKQGDHAGALRTLQQAMTMAREFKEPQKHELAWVNILCAQAALGDLAGAQESHAKVPATQPAYDMAITAIAKAQAAAGQEKAALATLDKLTKPAAKLIGMAYVVVGLAKSGNTQAARVLAEQVQELALKAPQQQQRQALFNLAKAQALAKDYEGALKTAALSDRGMLYPILAYFQAIAGDVGGALKIFDEHRSEPEAAWVENLKAIAHYQSQNGQDKEALAWIRQQTAPEVRAYGLLGVARGLLERQTAAARQK